MLKTHFSKNDLFLKAFYLKWNSTISPQQILKEEEKIQKWLRVKLQNEKLKISKLN